MTHFNSPAPAAVPTVAGAGSPTAVHQVNAAFAALANAVDGLTSNANALVCSPISDMGNAVAAISAAAEVVQHAQANLFGALAGIPTGLPTTPGFASASGLAGSNASAASSTVAAAAPVAAPPAAPAPPSFLRSSAPWLAGYLYNVIPTDHLASVPDNGDKWFAITRGKYVGLTKNSAISLAAVTGVSTGLSDKFNTQADALDHFNAALDSGAIALLV
ncbi:hypothetical protein DFH06DRAFT_1147085 [Mycena polygramma]|nr:hypothetical protein DFH06DRAFT_1147085 [Mycena polygramma]